MTSYMTMSFSKGKKSETSISHNNRSIEPDFDFSKAGHKHIKQEYTHLNQVWVHENIRDVYQREFGQAVDEYNKKQKRKDRKIVNYYDKVKANKNMRTQYEFVVQVGNKDNWDQYPDRNGRQWQAAAKILHEYYKGFQNRNPNLIVYNCALHLDEQGSPHIHMNVVPVGRKYQRGVNVRPSLKKALIQQGIEFDRHDSRLMWRNFQNREQEALADIAKQFGIERVAGVTNKLRDVHQYKEAMRLVDEAKEKERTAQARAEQAEQQAATQEEKSTEERKKLDQITAESTQKREKLDQVNADLFDKQDQLALIKKQVAAQQALFDSVADKKKQDKELSDNIDEKKQRLEKLDRDYEAKTDGWQQYQQTVEKITTMHKRLRKPEDYIVYTKTPLGKKFDEELTRGNIIQLINAAGKGALIGEVMAENKKLTVEQPKKIQEAVDKATAPYKKTVAKQNKELARKDSLIAELKDYVQLTMDSAREFVKKKVPEVYHEFVRGIGARLKIRGNKQVLGLDRDDRLEAMQGFKNPRQYDEAYNKAYNNNLRRQFQERDLE